MAWLHGGPLVLGDLVQSLPCAGVGGTAFGWRFGASRWGTEWANDGLQSDARGAHPINLRGARSRVHRVTSDQASIV